MPRETEEERRARKEKERRERPRETEEERAARKERERRERPRERPKETEEERAARKEKERRERPRETEEERAARKEKERQRANETEEERAARKERERRERPRETEEERNARKERERRERPKETEEERAARKEKERQRPNETEEERAARKERERRERPRETEEERAARKERERRERPKETEEERNARKEKEREERRRKEDEKSKREVIRKEMPAARGAAPTTPQAQDAKPKAEPVVQARPQAKPPSNDNDEEDGYDDDDFEEEFTADDMAAAAAAIARENAAAKAALLKNAAAGGSGGSASSPTEQQPKGEVRAGLDINSLERQKAKAQFEKDVARATALRRLVDLDDVSANIADIAPKSAYDLYITSFGGTQHQQVAVQAPPERGMDVEIQAERVHTKSKGIQAPEDLGLFPERYARGVQPQGEDGGSPSKSKKKQQSSVDTTALSSFMFRVFPTIRTLLDENELNTNPLSIQRKRSMVSQGFSTHAVPLEYEAIQGRPVVDVVFSRLSPQYLLVVYGPSDNEESQLAEYAGVALLWNTNDPSAPDKVLISHSELTCGTLSPTRAHLVYGGTKQGSVCTWDTREPDHYHSVASHGGYSPRLPSFTTDWNFGDNHKAPVISMCVAGYNSIMGQRKEEAEQLVSMDSTGAAHFWMIKEGDSKSAISNPTISDTEHGLHIFSSVSMFKASDVESFKKQMDQGEGSSVAFDMDFSPTDSSHLVVGSSTSVAHVSRFGSITAPSSYGPEAMNSASPATCVHFSPTDSRVLLAGYDDGNVRLYLKDQSKPQVTAPLTVEPIKRVRCSTNLKWSAFVLDAKGKFFVMDFATAKKMAPVQEAELSRSRDGVCTSFDVAMAERSEVRIATGYSGGLVEVHSLNDKIFAPPGQRQENWI